MWREVRREQPWGGGGVWGGEDEDEDEDPGEVDTERHQP